MNWKFGIGIFALNFTRLISFQRDFQHVRYTVLAYCVKEITAAVEHCARETRTNSNDYLIIYCWLKGMTMILSTRL